MADTKVGERIDHRVVDRWSCPDGPPFADALCPQRVAARGGGKRDGDEGGEIRRARYPVGGEAGRQGIALLVEDYGFRQRLGRALRNPSVDLSFDEHRVNAAPAIVHRNMTDQLHFPRLGVDLYDRDVHPGRIGRILHLEVVLRPQPRLTGRER